MQMHEKVQENDAIAPLSLPLPCIISFSLDPSGFPEHVIHGSQPVRFQAVLFT